MLITVQINDFQKGTERGYLTKAFKEVADAASFIRQTFGDIKPFGEPLYGFHYDGQPFETIPVFSNGRKGYVTVSPGTIPEDCEIFEVV